MNILLPDQRRHPGPRRAQPIAVRDEVGYLPEERGLYKKMTVRRLLRYYGQLKGRSIAQTLIPSSTLARPAAALRSGPTRRVETLSKGMAQKVQFISAIISRARRCSSSTNRSPASTRSTPTSLRDAVLDLRRRGTTIVFSTHDMTVAENICDRIFMIFNGRKVLDGTLDEIQWPVRQRHRPRATTAGAARRARRAAGVEAVNDHGNLQDVRLAGDPQAFLAALVARTRSSISRSRALAPRHLRAHRETDAGRAGAGGDPCVGC